MLSSVGCHSSSSRRRASPERGPARRCRRDRRRRRPTTLAPAAPGARTRDRTRAPQRWHRRLPARSSAHAAAVERPDGTPQRKQPFDVSFAEAGAPQVERGPVARLLRGLRSGPTARRPAGPPMLLAIWHLIASPIRTAASQSRAAAALAPVPEKKVVSRSAAGGMQSDEGRVPTGALGRSSVAGSVSPATPSSSSSRLIAA